MLTVLRQLGSLLRELGQEVLRMVEGAPFVKCLKFADYPMLLSVLADSADSWTSFGLRVNNFLFYRLLDATRAIKKMQR
jgi:hypothetical protein